MSDMRLSGHDFSLTLRPGTVKLGALLGRGGEGEVYAIAGQPRLVAKIFYPEKRTAERFAKLYAMVARPPVEMIDPARHAAVAWPFDVLHSFAPGRPVADLRRDAAGLRGFVMLAIDADEVPFLKICHPMDRRETSDHFTWLHQMRVASNIAGVLAVLHEYGYVVGDINEKNIYVNSRAQVKFIDCDSMQVRDKGSTYHCTVGVPEYQPPELQRASLQSVSREPYHDRFGLGVLIFKLLMENWHPYAGVWKSASEPPKLPQMIANGDTPYFGSRVLKSPPGAPPFTMLPPSIRELFRRCFVDGHKDPRKRPDAKQWQQALLEAQRTVRPCPRNPRHVYGSHLGECPWCQRVRAGLPDSYPPA